MTRWLKVVLALTLFVLPGCDAIQGKADFEVSALNRTQHVLRFSVNAQVMGEVPPGQSKAYTVELEVLKEGNGISSPTSYAVANFSAYDISTGLSSQKKSVRIEKDAHYQAVFEPGDFR